LDKKNGTQTHWLAASLSLIPDANPLADGHRLLSPRSQQYPWTHFPWDHKLEVSIDEEQPLTQVKTAAMQNNGFLQ
jgi:hypothetical protein